MVTIILGWAKNRKKKKADSINPSPCPVLSQSSSSSFTLSVSSRLLHDAQESFNYEDSEYYSLNFLFVFFLYCDIVRIQLVFRPLRCRFCGAQIIRSAKSAPMWLNTGVLDAYNITKSKKKTKMNFLTLAVVSFPHRRGSHKFSTTSICLGNKFMIRREIFQTRLGYYYCF